MPLQTLSRILDVDATFVSLQKDPRPDDKAVLRERTDIVDLTAHLTDFADTAALVRCLDLVITVDTSVAHLAGALGTPDLDPAALYARLSLAARSRRQPLVSRRAAVPQTATREYSSVLERIRNELRDLVAKFPQPSG